MHWLYNSDNLIKGHISSCSPDCLQEIISRDGLVRRNKVLSILCGNPRWAVVQQLVELGAVHLIQKLSKRLAPLFARKICAVDGGNHLQQLHVGLPAVRRGLRLAVDPSDAHVLQGGCAVELRLQHQLQVKRKSALHQPSLQNLLQHGSLERLVGRLGVDDVPDLGHHLLPEVRLHLAAHVAGAGLDHDGVLFAPGANRAVHALVHGDIQHESRLAKVGRQVGIRVANNVLLPGVRLLGGQVKPVVNGASLSAVSSGLDRSALGHHRQLLVDSILKVGNLHVALFVVHRLQHFFALAAAVLGTAVVHHDDVPRAQRVGLKEPIELSDLGAQKVLAVLVLRLGLETVHLPVHGKGHGVLEGLADLGDDGLGQRQNHAQVREE
mmetsp:Transcript_35810/g.67502  ORF Transcript_35810/g.67502 Transcript_35810/m.67502 type:complete len:381 (-) Transcript_35810:565-1707(-)